MSSWNSDSASNSDTKNGKPFDYDDILDHIGQFGKFQFIIFTVLCYASLFPVPFYTTFTVGTPKYRCWIDGCDNKTSLVFEPEWLNKTMPWIWTESKAGCQRFNQTLSPDACLVNDLPVEQTIIGCDRWVYDDTLFKSTVVTDFDLTCEDEWKQSFTRTIYMMGMLVGAVSLGSTADILGRKPAFTIVAVVDSCVNFGTVFVQDYISFVVLTFFAGLANTGVYSIAFVWGVEAVGAKYRVTCGFIYQAIFSVGGLILSGIAYFVRDWRIIQLIVSVPMFLQITFFWFLPESIRWLITKKRYAEAKKLILKAAKTNKKSVPAHLLVVPGTKRSDSVSTITGQLHANVKSDTNDTESVTPQKNQDEDVAGTMSDIFRTPVLLKRLVVICFAWLAAVMGYYGVTFAAANLAGDFHLNFALSLLVEIPGFLIGIYPMNKFGRKVTLFGSLMIGGISCLITGLVPEDPAAIRVAFSLVGKIFSSLVLSVVYSYTSELFHTSARGIAIGLCSTIGRVGGILAPTIADTGKTLHPAVPYIIFASVNIFVGLLSLTLPETIGISFPATLQDAKDLEQYTNSCFRFGKRKKKTGPGNSSVN